MAGAIQSALGGAITTAAAAGAGAKKLYEDERQASEKAELAKEAEKAYKEDVSKEGRDIALEADLIRMGADPDSARSFMVARELGLDTKQFGQIRKKGKFVGTYSSLAEKLSKDAVTDSLSSKAINDYGFNERLKKLGGSRKEKVEALVKAYGD